MKFTLDDIRNDLELYGRLMRPEHVYLVSQTKGEHIGIGVRESSTPIAYMVVRISREQSQASIIALEVEKSYSGYGLETILLQFLEGKLKEKNYHYLTYDIVVQESESAAREFLQPEDGWDSGQVLSTVYIADMGELKSAKWMNTIRAPLHFRTFSWAELTEANLTSIQEGRNRWYPEKFSPWQEGYDIDHQLSVALQYKGEIIGWLMVKRAASNMALFKSLFVREEFTRLGRAGVVLVEGLKKVLENQEIRYAMFVVEKDNAAMLQMVRKHFTPYIIRRKKLISFRKSIL